jgi:HK97 family phage major capsid protein
MDGFQEIIKAVEAGNNAFEEFKKANDRRLDALETSAAKAGRPHLGGGGSSKPLGKQRPQFYDTKSQRVINVLGRDDSMAALDQKSVPSSGLPSVGRVLRGIVLGSRAHDAAELEEERKSLSIGSNTGGGFTIAGALSSQWIDLLRSRLVLNAAGVTTVPMDNNSLTLAKLTGDPTVSWHGENAPITDSDLTLGAVSLTAKTATCLVKLSLELSQDSANIEQILQSSITQAMAHAIDEAGLIGVTTNAGAAPATGTGIFNLTGRNTVLSVGAPTNWDWAVDAMYALLANNVSMDNVGAMIAHPALWKKMRKLKTGISGDQTPLETPEELASLKKLWTTAAPFTGGTTAKAIMGDWSDLLFGVRKDINVQVLNQAFLGSNLQLAVLAYVRCDFAATRASSFVTAEGITVS